MNMQFRADPRAHKGRQMMVEGVDHGPRFAKMFFTETCEAQLREALHMSRVHGGIAFNPMAASPGAEGRRCVYVNADAAGYSDNHDLQSQGGGGAWMVSTGVENQQPWPVHWMYRPWAPHEIMQFSTWLEAENGTQLVPVAIAHKAQDIILVLDNRSWVDCAKKLSCKAEDMVVQVERLARVLEAQTDVRLFVVFHHREHGPEADAISKAEMAMHKSGGEWKTAQEPPTAEAYAAGTAALGVDAASMMLQARGFQALTPANRIALHSTTETV